MVNLLKTQKLGIFLAVFLAAVLLWLFLGVFPLLDKIKVTSETYLSNQEILWKLNQRENLAKNLENNLREKEADLSLINKALLNREEVVGFIATLETIADKTGNQYEIKLVQNQASPGNGSDVYIFNIAIAGSYANLLRFVSNLENTPYPPYRLIKIEKASVYKMGENELTAAGLASNNVKSVLEIKIFVNSAP